MVDIGNLSRKEIKIFYLLFCLFNDRCVVDEGKFCYISYFTYWASRRCSFVIVFYLLFIAVSLNCDSKLFINNKTCSINLYLNKYVNDN